MVKSCASSDVNRENIFTESCDYVVVANGHNSVPNDCTIEGKEHFKGKIMHTHNFRRPDTDFFVKKRVAVLGTSYSGSDMMVQLLTNPVLGDVGITQIILVGDCQYLKNTTDYKKFVDDGRVVFKEGRPKRILENGRIQFADDSEAEVDTIVFATGYRFSFPFLENSGDNLITMELNGKYFGPLYSRMFSTNEANLIFIGQNDFSFYIQLILERECIIVKKYLEGKIQLPSKQEMLKDLDDELKTYDKSNLQKYWRLRPQVQDISHLKKLASLGKGLELNQTLIDKLFPLGVLCCKNEDNGDWHLFRYDPKLMEIFPDYTGDHSFYEEDGVKKELF